MSVPADRNLIHKRIALKSSLVPTRFVRIAVIHSLKEINP